MFYNIFKIIFTPKKISTIKYDTIFIGFIILFYFWFSPFFRNLTLYAFFIKSILLLFFIFFSNVIRAFFHPIEKFRDIFPYYMLSLSPLLLIGFFSFLKFFLVIPFIWIELLKGYKDLSEKNLTALIVGTILDLIFYIMLWR
jgi:hypothetical protein